MSTNISTASEQWRKRPEDQRFKSLGELKASIEKRQHISREHDVNLKELHASVENGKLILANGSQMRPTNWGFDQLARSVSAPPRFLPRCSTQRTLDSVAP